MLECNPLEGVVNRGVISEVDCIFSLVLLWQNIHNDTVRGHTCIINVNRQSGLVLAPTAGGVMYIVARALYSICAQQPYVYGSLHNLCLKSKKNITQAMLGQRQTNYKLIKFLRF